MRIIYGLYLVCITSYVASTQTTNWFVAPAIQVGGKMNPQSEYFFGAEPEYDFNDRRVGQIDLSGGASYKLGDFKMTGSVVYRRKWPAEEGHEWRLWQQLSHAFNVNTVRVRNRIRIEERFDRDREAASYETRQRLRYRIAFDAPLQGQRLDPKEWYLNLTAELLYDDVLDQSQREREIRYYLGFGYQFLQGNRLEPAIDVRFAKEADGAKQSEGLFRLTYILKLKRKQSQTDNG